MSTVRTCLILLAIAALIGPALVSGQGFVVVSGDDADDSGHCQRTRCGRLYPKLFNEGLARSRSGGSGILAIGANSREAASSFLGWNDPVNGGPGAPFFRILGPTAIGVIDFNDFALVYIASTERHTPGGLTSADIAALNQRQPDLAEFVNVNGGSLIMLTQEGAPGEWGSLPVPLETADSTFIIATPTSSSRSPNA